MIEYIGTLTTGISPPSDELLPENKVPKQYLVLAIVFNIKSMPSYWNCFLYIPYVHQKKRSRNANDFRNFENDISPPSDELLPASQKAQN